MSYSYSQSCSDYYDYGYNEENSGSPRRCRASDFIKSTVISSFYRNVGLPHSAWMDGPT